MQPGSARVGAASDSRCVCKSCSPPAIPWMKVTAVSAPSFVRGAAARAVPLASPARDPVRHTSTKGGALRADKTAHEAVQAKSNIVPSSSWASPPKRVAPTLVQAQPGATTTLMSKRPVPPAHQQTGLPKVAATPDFVDKTTLLPQRGAQGAATRAVVASAPTERR